MASEGLPLPGDRSAIARFLYDRVDFPFDTPAEARGYVEQLTQVAAKNVSQRVSQGQDYGDLMGLAVEHFRILCSEVEAEAAGGHPELGFWEEVKRRLCPTLLFC